MALGEVGVSYGRVANNLPNPASVVQLLKRNGIKMVRLYDTNPEVLRALANTGIKVLVMLPNEDLATTATNRASALQWVVQNVVAHYPAMLIDGVAVGNEVFGERRDFTLQLVPAMTNVQGALASLGLADAVKVSTPIAFTALKNTFPPSSGRFRDDIVQSVMKPTLQFLQKIGSYLTVNPYLFFAYAHQQQDIPLDYALGNYTPGKLDNNTGLVYHSMLDAMMDATFFAIENLTGRLDSKQPTWSGWTKGLLDFTKWTETGWPSRGAIRNGKGLLHDGESRLDAAGDGVQAATLANAKAYNNYVIKRVRSRKGTPYRPNADMDIYIFALFNENAKGQGPDDVERYFGLFHPNEFDFRGGRTSVANTSSDWCCTIQPGSKCFEPNNTYYQRALGTSDDFALEAHVVVYRQPKYGHRILPLKSWIEVTAADPDESHPAV